jgi:hypothetical protein
MNVQELIDQLSLIEDKSLPVLLDDWNDGSAFPHQCDLIRQSPVKYYSNYKIEQDPKYGLAILLGVS